MGKIILKLKILVVKYSVAILIVFCGLIYFLSQSAMARPEYAVRNAVVSCTACHMSPSGGGFKNLNGKLYSADSRGYRFTPKKYQENLSLDLRMLYYQGEKFKGSRGGLGLMTATVGGVLPIEENSDYKMNAVANYDMGAFPLAGPRDVYVITNLGDKRFFEDITVGKFIAPFGLLTDEHRTYTRMQSVSSFNDFVMGAMVSGRFIFDNLHYDFGLISGQPSSSTAGQFATENSNGGVVNFRWVPAFLPLYFGASGSYYSSNLTHDPTANSAYLALSLDRLTNSWIRGALLLESVRSKFFNTTASGSQISNYFIGTDAAYQAAVDNSEAEGIYGLLNIELTPRTMFSYKFDSLSLDKRYDGDRYSRHGFGLRQSITGQTFVTTRYEIAKAGRSGVDNSLRANQNAFWLLLQAWF